MALSNVMAEKGALPSSLFHISQDCDKSNRSGNPVQ